jgi:hypothetical protein
VRGKIAIRQDLQDRQNFLFPLFHSPDESEKTPSPENIVVRSTLLTKSSPSLLFP